MHRKEGFKSIKICAFGSIKNMKFLKIINKKKAPESVDFSPNL